MGSMRDNAVRSLATALSLALVATGCGSASAPTKDATIPVVSTKPAPHVEPCGPGTPGPSDAIGVSADAITVGVVVDVSGPRAQFRPNWQAMQAFAAFCNYRGGIAGRRLDVRLFDTKVFDRRTAISDSCVSVFALVGSAAVFDGDGATIESDCGIPDVPAVDRRAGSRPGPHRRRAAPEPAEPLPGRPAALPRDEAPVRDSAGRDGVSGRRCHRGCVRSARSRRVAMSAIASRSSPR